MSLRRPSYVSPTTGSDQKTPLPALSRAAFATRASRTTPTLCVLVIPITPPSIPDSRTHSRPVSSPLPLSRWAPANTGSVQTRSSWGTTMVTPVRTGPSPDHQRPVAADERRVADQHPGDVRDRVLLPRLEQADAQAELASAHVNLPVVRGVVGRGDAAAPYHRPVANIPEAPVPSPVPATRPGAGPPLAAPCRRWTAPRPWTRPRRSATGLAWRCSRARGPGRTGRFSYLTADPARRGGRAGGGRRTRSPRRGRCSRRMADAAGGTDPARAAVRRRARRVPRLRPRPPPRAPARRSRASTSTCRCCASRSMTGSSPGTAGRRGLARRARGRR